MKTYSTENIPLLCPNLLPLTEVAHDADAQLLRSLAAERQARRQPEHERAEMIRLRWERIRAANEAVDAYMRESGTTNYQAAFNHIQHTRPDLFGGVQNPSRPLAANFNPYHDQLGRFTTSGGAEGGRNDGLDGQGGGQTKPASIAQYSYPREGKQNYARCALYSLQTIIAAKTGKEAPSEAEVQARFEAEATKLGLTIKWSSGPRFRNVDYATVVSNVLKSYGIESSYKFGYGSPQDLANAIIAAKGEPAMLDIALTGHEGKEEHSVTVQWEPKRHG